MTVGVTRYNPTDATFAFDGEDRWAYVDSFETGGETEVYVALGGTGLLPVTFESQFPACLKIVRRHLEMDGPR